MADRWLKLAVNAQSAVHAIVDPRDHDANEFFDFKACLLEEVGRVYRAARIRARSCDGRDPAIAQMIEDLRRPRAKRTSHGMNVHNSTWQDLYLKRDVLETPRYHELLIELAGEHGIAVPYNEATLAALLEVHASGAGPESMRLSELRSAVEERKGAR
jgi:ketopantoate reductase